MAQPSRPPAAPTVAFYAQLRSEACRIRSCVSASRAFLADHGAPAHAAHHAELVLAEVLNNIAEHAYCADAPGWIGLALRLQPGGVEVCVCDRGIPMPQNRPPEIALPDPAGLPEGGFGWFLIHELSQELVYRHEGGLNRLTFRLPLR